VKSRFLVEGHDAGAVGLAEEVAAAAAVVAAVVEGEGGGTGWVIALDGSGVGLVDVVSLHSTSVLERHLIGSIALTKKDECIGQASE